MKIVTSYFYKIRFFTPNIIPLSTAVWDPKWFHRGQGKDFMFYDKRGVLNGLRCEVFMPDSSCNDLCCGHESCSNEPLSCEFLKAYRRQLDRLNFNKVIEMLNAISECVQKEIGFNEEPVIALIVHEASSNPCSERVALHQWFKDNHYDIQEFT